MLQTSSLIDLVKQIESDTRDLSRWQEEQQNANNTGNEAAAIAIESTIEDLLCQIKNSERRLIDMIERLSDEEQRELQSNDTLLTQVQSVVKFSSKVA